MRKHNILCIAFVTLLITTGCQTPTPQPDNIVASPAPQQDVFIPDLNSREPVTIRVADFEGYGEFFYDALIMEFERLHPNITVNFVPINYQGSFDFDAATLAPTADVLVALYDLGREDVPYLRELSPFIEADSSFDQNDYWPGVFDACEPIDRVVALPTNLRFYVLFYDPLMFDAAAVAYPQPDWNIDDFVDAARQLTHGSGDDKQYGFVLTSESRYMIEPYLQAALEQSSGHIDPRAINDALNWFITLAHDEAMLIPERIVQDSVTQSIAQGRVAMWVGELDQLTWRRNFGGRDTTMPAAIPLASNGMNSIPESSHSCMVMSAGTQHPNEAWLWMSFATQHSTDFAEAFTPARQSTADAIRYWDLIEPEMVSVVRYSVAHVAYRDPRYLEYSILNDTIVQTLQGEGDVIFALEQLPALTPTPEPSAPNSVAVNIIVPEPTPEPQASVAIKYFANPQVHGFNNAMQALVESFMNNFRDIRIELVDVAPDNTSLNDLTSSFDCFVATAPGGDGLDAILNLDPFLDAGDNALLDDYEAWLLDQFRVNGQLYALPAASTPTILYYNIDHFNALGLAPPAPGMSYDNFIALATIASANEVYGFVPLRGDVIDFLFSAQSLKLSDVWAQPPSLRLDDPDVIGIVEQIVGMAKDGSMPAFDPGGIRSAGGNYNLRRDAVSSGQAAMWTDLAGQRSGFAIGAAPPFRIGIAPLPRTRGVMSAPVASGFYISRQASEPLACWAWIKFLSAQPFAFATAPARRSVLLSPQWESAVGADTAAALRATLSRPVAQITARDPAGLPIRAWLGDAIAPAFEGEEITTALSRAQQKVDSYVACLSTLDRIDAASSLACAQQADPDYHLMP